MSRKHLFNIPIVEPLLQPYPKFDSWGHMSPAAVEAVCDCATTVRQLDEKVQAMSLSVLLGMAKFNYSSDLKTVTVTVGYTVTGHEDGHLDSTGLAKTFVNGWPIMGIHFVCIFVTLRLTNSEKRHCFERDATL